MELNLKGMLSSVVQLMVFDTQVTILSIIMKLSVLGWWRGQAYPKTSYHLLKRFSH